MFKYVYHASRVIFGGWWLYSGAMHFISPAWQPMGHEPAAIAFTHALIDSGLFRWVKILEIVLGITMLAHRAMPLTLMALVPINVVIVYWNLVLDPATVDYVFGALSIVFNLVLLWPWRAHFYPLFVGRGGADYGLQPA
ncbi:MAG TPA: hypothetical protein VMF03_19005 [Steroidobacteraceae bacterium]|nr:hypothetical protein [Steroidobacteraceae bacterium]